MCEKDQRILFPYILKVHTTSNNASVAVPVSSICRPGSSDYDNPFIPEFLYLDSPVFEFGRIDCCR